MISLIASTILIASSCNQTKKLSVNQDQKIIVDTTDCFPDRKNQDTVQVTMGTVETAGDSYFIISLEDNRKYSPCNMPEACKTKGLKVECVVIKKEIFPYERWAATPSMLKSISIKE
jgi:hypothetical protein